MLKFLESKIFIVLFGIFLIGLILKLINFWDIQIFAYDQARDAQRIIEILGGNLKLVGPETDIKGIFNGPLFYYILAPVYLLSNFDPNIVNLFMVLVNLSGIFIIYYLCVILFRNKNAGLISAFLWAISYEQANFARFISNASFMSIATLVFFLGLALYFVRNNRWGLPLSVLGLGTAVHFNIYLGYLVLFYPLLFILYKKKPKVKDILLSLSLFVLILSPFLVAEIKFNFMGTKALIAYFGKHVSESGSLVSNLSAYPARISGALYFGFFSFNKLFSFLLLGGSLVYLYKEVKDRKSILFLLLWTFSTFPLFFFRSGVITAEVINTSIFGALTIIFGLTIYKLLTSKYSLVGLLILGAIIVSNLSLFVDNKFKPYNLFALQTLVLKNEKEAIDYTYESAKGEKFSICALTNPVTINTLWSYLYKYYGEKKYGYIPNWSGKKQFMHSSYLPYDQEHLPRRYLIIEPLGGIPEFAKWATIYQEDQVSILEEEKRFGDLIVQKRILDYNKGDPRETQGLSEEYLSRTLNLLTYEQSGGR